MSTRSWAKAKGILYIKKYLSKKEKRRAKGKDKGKREEEHRSIQKITAEGMSNRRIFSRRQNQEKSQRRK